MRLGKRMTSMLLALFLFSQPVQGLTLNIHQGQEQTDIEIEPIIKGETIYFPIRDIATKLKYGVAWDSMTREIVLVSEHNIIQLGSKSLIENGDGFIEAGTTYIKEDYLERLLGVRLEVEDLTKSIAPKGEAIIELLMKDQYQEVVNKMDSVAKELIGEKIIRDHWNEIEKAYGIVESYEVDDVRKLESYYQVDLRLKTELAHIRAITTFNFNGELSGLQFPSLYTYEKALPIGASEVALSIQNGEYTLPATLTLPEGEGPFAAVVLVHGSGPNDQDETIGGVKVFRDLAYGLAEQGVATLRYDKRTYAYAQEVKENPSLFGYDDEVISDAVCAAELLKTTEGINPDAVYVLGHSLGGMSIPLISTQIEEIAGYIMVAAPSRHLADLVYEQIDYITTEEGMTSLQKQIYMDTIESQIKKVKALTHESVVEEMLFTGINNRTWADLNDYNQLNMAMEMEEPLLILQGGRDYQVTMEDYREWEVILGHKKNVTLKDYPNLNHLLVEGDGKSVPKEYYMPNEVSHVLIQDIGAWINTEDKPYDVDEVEEIEATKIITTDAVEETELEQIKNDTTKVETVEDKAVTVGNKHQLEM